MKVEFGNRFIRLWCVFSLYVMCIFRGVQSNRGGFLYFQFLCYKNPGHIDSSGQRCDTFPSINCDPFFTICISNRYISNDIRAGNCPIFYMVSSTYDNQESVCKKTYDNRGALGNVIIKELPYPFQKTIYVKIEVRDDDGLRGSERIASFSAEYTEIPSFNLSTPIYKEISMFRNEYRYSNPKASLRISLALQCDIDRFGEHCLTFCRSTQSSNYICSKDGQKICKEGWRGENCLESDVCFFQFCIDGAKCIEVNGEGKCVCNGQIGPQCYPNYNPCSDNPCENHGRCIPNKTHNADVRCHCSFPFHGSRCENKFDMCALEPCHNNATCEYNENYTRRCICLDGFAGALCDHKLWDVNDTSDSTGPYSLPQNRTKAVMILSILFGISVVVFIAAIFVYILKKRKKKYLMKNKADLTVNMSDIDKRLHNPSAVSNEYVVKTAPETIYETVNDRDTYAYLIEKNDEYLVPSRPTTPGFASTPGAGSTVYLDMFSNLDNNTLPSDKPIPNRDSLDLPPLPTRDHKRRLSLKTFCIP